MLALVFLFALSLSAAGQTAPNVVVILTDDQGYGDLGVYGAEGFSTPRIDSLAADGMKFTDFYVPAPVCTPTRAALLTGSYPVRLGLGHRVIFPFMTTGLNPDEITLAEVLKGRGYRTAAVGKWHLGHHGPFLPTRQGFDSYFGIPYSNDMGSHYYAAQRFTAPPLPILRDERLIEQHPAQELLTKRYTREAVNFIRDSAKGPGAGAPFFLYLAHSMPHLPIAASSDFRGKTAHGLYGDVIEEIDWSVGEILDALEETGVAENTLVLFTSDNGPVIRPAERLGHRPGSAGPLRGTKNTTWEGGMRVPFLARWPGRIPAGAVCGELATAMDILPTVARIAGAEPPKDRIVDGKDIGPLLLGELGARSPHKAFYYYRDNRLQAVRSGAWKLHLYRPEWGEERHAPLLFNLDADVGESRNVAEQNPEVVARLTALAEEARDDLGDAVSGRQGRNLRPVGELPTRP